MAKYEKAIADTLAKGIPVFGFDVGAQERHVDSFGAGQSGINIGKFAEAIGGKGKVAILTGFAVTYLERRRSNWSALSKYPDITIVGVYANDNDYEKH